MAAQYTLATRVKLADGQTIPQIQLGLYQMSPKEAYQAIRWAIPAGYRGFDCAQMYRNEAQSGKAILDSLKEDTSLTREDIFYTTKLASCDTDYDSVRKSIKRSVDVSKLGYVDLMLLHSPYGGKQARLTSWKALEDAVGAGEIKMAGVSNFGIKHIEELMASKPRIQPVINQIEVHPFNAQEGIREASKKYGIAVLAYSPLARAERMTHPDIVSYAKKYSCTPAQLLVRWSVQHDMITLPKSTKQKRLLENADINGFEISAADMKALDGLDENLVLDWDPTNAP